MPYKYLNLLTIFVVLEIIGGAAGAADPIPEIRVTTRRLQPAANEPLFASNLLDQAALNAAPGLRLDDVLRTIPGFGLFRRQSSRAAHPTTHGVTLRGLGASGAGRTLVMLDGVPQNDPFGGWIDWSRLPTASIGSAIITKGGGAGPWGNTALAGVIRLEGRAYAPSSGVIDVRGGERGTFEGTAAGSVGWGRAIVSASASGHSTNGSFIIRQDQRGPIDRKADNQGGAGSVAAEFTTGDLDVLLRATYSEDRLINGIDLARSKSQIADASIGVVRTNGDNGWEAHAYVRDQDFSAIFVAVNATRTAATLSLDQFSVPAQAAGGNFIYRQDLSEETDLSLGADVRYVTGDTNENFQNTGAGFTRLRKAGGEQTLAGAFTEINWQPSEAVLVTGGARADYWRQYDGIRRESVIATGVVARDDRFASADGVVGSFRLGGRFAVDDTVALRAVAYSGFRVPTLNELYRPFRVGNDITEANAGLTPEKMWGGDLALEWTPSDKFKFGLTYYRNWLKDSVINITIRSTPGLDPGTGVTVPAGGVLRQRRNLPRAVTDGVEAEAVFTPLDTVSLALRYLFADPTVTRSPDQPALVGTRLAQVPRHQGTVSLDWRPVDPARVNLQARYASSQFDDDLNLRVLKSYAVFDATFGWQFTANAEAVVSAENVFNYVIPAGLSADGLVSIGTPRVVTAGVRLNF